MLTGSEPAVEWPTVPHLPPLPHEMVGSAGSDATVAAAGIACGRDCGCGCNGGGSGGGGGGGEAEGGRKEYAW